MDFNIELKRNHYYNGKRINKEDLTLEQQYFLDKIKIINKMLVGYGIIKGLTIDEFNASKKTITINPGLGIDSHGNFITLLEKKVLNLPKKLLIGEYIYLKYIQTDEDRKPISDPATCDGDCTFNHLVDDVEIYVSKKLEMPNVRNICTGKDTDRNDKVIKNPILFLGQYKKGRNKTIIDVSSRAYIHTNTEIFKLLCTINKAYVSSVNGLHGDLNLVSSITDVVPNDNGEIELLGGNNISINTEDNKITINTKSGFFQEYHIRLANNAKKDINHHQKKYPIVDVYRKERVANDFEVYIDSEVKRRARDLEIDFDDYVKEQEFEVINKKYRGLNNKNLTVKEALNKHKILGNASSKVLKVSEKKMHYYAESIYVAPRFQYEKIVGGQDTTMKIEVTHISNSSLRLTNRTGETIDILVILNT